MFSLIGLAVVLAVLFVFRKRIFAVVGGWLSGFETPAAGAQDPDVPSSKP